MADGFQDMIDALLAIALLLFLGYLAWTVNDIAKLQSPSPSFGAGWFSNT